MCDQLPNWVYDLVNEVLDWEESGHDLPDEVYRALPNDFPFMDSVRSMCHDSWVKPIPQDVRDVARAIAAYKRNADS